MVVLGRLQVYIYLYNSIINFCHCSFKGDRNNCHS